MPIRSAISGIGFRARLTCDLKRRGHAGCRHRVSSRVTRFAVPRAAVRYSSIWRDRRRDRPDRAGRCGARTGGVVTSTDESSRSERRGCGRRSRGRRDAIPAGERARLSDRIAVRLLDLIDRRAPRTVMLFASFGSEIETRGIIETLDRAGRRVALPVVAGPELRAVAFRPGDPVRTARYGAAEPRLDRRRPAGCDRRRGGPGPRV